MYLIHGLAGVSSFALCFRGWSFSVERGHVLYMHWGRLQYVLLESNCLEPVKSFNDPSLDFDWRARSVLLNDIRSLNSDVGSILLTWINKYLNETADWVASMTCKVMCLFGWVASPHSPWPRSWLGILCDLWALGRMLASEVLFSLVLLVFLVFS